ncbi:hypothetical protein DFJ58DRAFT_610958, partial [Suillus subalutaceus]|uniref:uncharacterized protein n=1 Tax=Suillus subalutaceus TaxID=48586 RepID=UPI001B87FCA2
ELYKSIDITHSVTSEYNSTLILAPVKYIHVRKGVFRHLTKFKPVTRLDNISYFRVEDAYRI